MSRYLYKNITEQLKYRILSGFYPLGCTMPSIRKLAEVKKCNTATVSRALIELRNTGLVTNRLTKSYVVTDSVTVVENLRYLEQKIALIALCTSLSSLGLNKNEILEMVKKCCDEYR